MTVLLLPKGDLALFLHCSSLAELFGLSLHTNCHRLLRTLSLPHYNECIALNSQCVFKRFNINLSGILSLAKKEKLLDHAKCYRDVKG